jgi:hypothetical protein
VNLKTLNRVKLISSNTIRQILTSVFAVAIPFMVIKFFSKEIWGEFVSILLYTLFVTQIINWGNKEYLLRIFSETPSKIKSNFSTNFFTRLPLFFIFSIVGFFLFKIEYGIFIFLWLLGRFLIHSYEVLVIYEKKFSSSVFIEIICFLLFTGCIYLYTNSITIKTLVFFYSIYQLIKGFGLVMLFRNILSFKKSTINLSYYKQSIWFFLLSILGFLASKIDVYIINSFGKKTITSDYQIINSMLVFVMSISTFIYTPFTKNLYRNNENIITKTKILFTIVGLIIIPISLFIISFILDYFLNITFSVYFYIIAFFYIIPSYIYGTEIVNLFKQHKEKKVVLVLFIGVLLNFILSYLLLKNSFEIVESLLGATIAQIIVLFLFNIKTNAN